MLWGIRAIPNGNALGAYQMGSTAFSLLVLTERPHQRGFSSRTGVLGKLACWGGRTGVPGKLACWGGSKAALRCPVLFRVEVKML
jgi:hypothetical protein